MFLYQFRLYVTSSDNPWRSSCCSDAETCQVYVRLPHPVSTSSAYVVPGTTVPNRLFEMAPHSPFAAGLVNTQSGVKLRFPSIHERDVLLTARSAGLFNSEKPDPRLLT